MIFFKQLNMETKKQNIKVSVILPCQNEEKSLGQCISNIKNVFKKHNIQGEIIVSDSSVDNSPIIAEELGAVLIKHDKDGYGMAYLEGFKVARGRYFFLADPDGTYDFKEIPRFLNYLDKGYDFVIGNRFAGEIEPGAMPWQHRYFGNPFLSFILSVFFRKKISDVHCGMRALTRNALNKLKLQTTGMEFASEMVAKAIKNNLKIKEIPINYYIRKGDSKLRSLSDGWKHLRFMLLYSPVFLFFIPGLFLFLLGLITMFWFYFGRPEILGIKLFFHPIFIASLLIIIGYQVIIFAVFAKTYAITHLGEKSQIMDNLYKYITIERASIFGIIVSLSGAIIYLLIFYNWVSSGFGALNEIKNSIVALTLLIVGIQTIFSSFMLSILGIKEK